MTGHVVFLKEREVLCGQRKRDSSERGERERRMPPKTKQAEEERLLLESSRHVTRTATALFYGNGFIVSALPLCTLKEKERD